MSSYIVGLFVGIAICAALRYLWKRRKTGETGCGKNCPGCPSKDFCKKSGIEK